MASFNIKRFSIDNIAWTPIVAPGHSDSVTLESLTYGYLLRTVSADGTTEISRLVGMVENIDGHSPSRNPVRARFVSGATVVYAKSLGASDTLVARFIGASE